MEINLKEIISDGDTVAVAVSGGEDSMALLYYMKKAEKKFGVKVKALNVEHGIRGKSSLSDTEFVKDFCAKFGIEVISYSVKSVEKAKAEKIPVEQAARILRYECFFDALKKGKCTIVATAHHLSDNAESVLFNLFRGSGSIGASGINPAYQNKIVRPFIGVKKEEIEKYVKENEIPYVTDESNFDDNLTRNNIRHKLLPEIKKLFPEVEKSLYRFTEISGQENEFLEKETLKKLKKTIDGVQIKLPCDKAILYRASIKALKIMGMEKDWEKIHADSVYALSKAENGAKVNLPQKIIAIKEYDRIVFYKENNKKPLEINFKIGKIKFGLDLLKIEKVSAPFPNLKTGLYLDGDKISDSAVIRTRCDGDEFKKFGGGTKKLNDYFTDKKIPLRLRDSIPLIAEGKNILAIFGVAVSDRCKVDDKTVNLIKITKE